MSITNAVRKLTTHYKCRNGKYPRCPNIQRFPVPDDKVSWHVPWDQYDPVEFTSQAILNQPWADPSPNEAQFRPEWNQLDGSIDRRSHFSKYDIRNGLPVNPVGRTGVIGRGCLGRWGPNHAADSIVTRWRRNESNEVEKDPESGKPILQFVAIERRDCHEWAIPGGMVDPGEKVSATLKREFMEEALSCLTGDDQIKAEIEKSVGDFFKNGVEIYTGYVDDPRNTDNAWMETVATNFHDEDGLSVGRFKLAAGDDAVGVKWMDVHSGLNLYASHAQILRAVAEMRQSFW